MPFKSYLKTTILPFLLSLSAFILLVASTPRILSQFIPCLKMIPGVAVSYQTCSTLFILDAYIATIITGMIMLSFLTYVVIKPRKKIYTIILTSIFAAITIIAYHRFIPTAEKAVNSAPLILLENMKKR